MCYMGIPSTLRLPSQRRKKQEQKKQQPPFAFQHPNTRSPQLYVPREKKVLCVWRNSENTQKRAKCNAKIKMQKNANDINAIGPPDRPKTKQRKNAPRHAAERKEWESKRGYAEQKEALKTRTGDKEHWSWSMSCVTIHQFVILRILLLVSIVIILVEILKNVFDEMARLRIQIQSNCEMFDRVRLVVDGFIQTS